MSARALPVAAPAVARRRWARRNAWPIGVYVLLAILIGVEKAVHPTLNSYDVQSLVGGALPLCLAAMAQAAVVLAGGIDLAVGSLMSLINVLAASYMVNADLKGALAISVLLLVVGGLAGALTGVAITITRVPDIIVTLATSFIWAGLALQIMPTPGGGAPLEFTTLFTGEVGGILPTGLLVLVVALLAWTPLRRSRLGLSLYAVGSNRAAAFLSGIDVARTRVASYAVGGVFAALGGLALTASTSNGNATSGASYTLNSVAAIVVGGVSLTGGRGGMLGAIGAAFVLTLINTVLQFMGVDPNTSVVIQGALVVAIVMIAGFILVRRTL